LALSGQVLYSHDNNLIHCLLFSDVSSRDKIDACSCPSHIDLLAQGLVSSEQQESVERYVKAALHKSDRERSETAKDKTGVFTGVTCATTTPMTRGCRGKAS
jgi:hypothetical protein